MSAMPHKSWLAGIAVAAGVGAAAAAGQGVAAAETGSTGDGPSSSAAGSADGSGGSSAGSADGSAGSKSASDGSTTGKDASEAGNATPQSKVDATGGSKKRTPAGSEGEAEDTATPTSPTTHKRSIRSTAEDAKIDADADATSDEEGADLSTTAVTTLTANVNASPTTEPNLSGDSDSSARRFESNDSTPQTPAAPSASALEAVGAFLRRQIVHTLFNHTPTATPTVVDETDDGVITGSVGAVDPDGDPLRYKVTATPLHGTVVVADDGTYTYTESTDPAHRGLPDSFTVTVDDSAGIELPGVLGVVQSILHTGAQLLGFAQPDTRDVTILVNPLVGADQGIPVGQEPVAAVSKPGTTTVYVVNHGDNTVSVVDTTAGAISKTIPVGHGPTAAAINPQGTAVYVLNQSDNTVSVIDTATNSVTATVPGVANAGALVASTTNVYVTRVGTNSVYNIDAATKTVSTLDVGSNPLALAISPDGKTLYVARGNGIIGYSVAAIDTGTKAITKTVNVGVTPIGVALTADGKNLYVVSNSTAAGVPLIDTATMAVTKTFTVLSLGGTPQSIAVGPQGTVVMAMRGGSGWLEVLNSAAGVFQPAFGSLSSDQAGLVFVNGDHLLLVDRPGNRLLRVTK